MSIIGDPEDFKIETGKSNKTKLTERHIRLREVYDTLASISDGHRGHSEVGFLFLESKTKRNTEKWLVRKSRSMDRNEVCRGKAIFNH